MASYANQLILEMEKLEDESFAHLNENIHTNPHHVSSSSKRNKLTENHPKILAFILTFALIILSLIFMLRISNINHKMDTQDQIWATHLSLIEAKNSNQTKILESSLTNLNKKFNPIEIDLRSTKLKLENLSNLTLIIQNKSTKLMEIVQKNHDNLTQTMDENDESMRRNMQNISQKFLKWFTTIIENIRNIYTKTNETQTEAGIFEKLANEMNNQSLTILRPKNCLEIQKTSQKLKLALLEPEPIHTIYPFGPESLGIQVRCDFQTDGGGWTLIQKRVAGPRDEFFKNWRDYENGFGTPQKSYWLGLSAIRALTLESSQILRVDLGDWQGNFAYANYDNFLVGDASTHYQLTLGRYSGNAGDSLNWHNRHKFSTKDSEDHDQWTGGNCAQERHGAWWYYSCSYSNLNGYYWNQSETVPPNDGIIWYHWKGDRYSLKSTEMKIRNADAIF